MSFVVLGSHCLHSKVGGEGGYSPIVEDGAIKESMRSAETRTVIKDLHPSTVYRFKVAAVNDVGTGPNSIATTALTTKTPEGDLL